MDLATFFEDEGVDVYCSVGIEALSDADRTAVLQFLPAARSVIVFGKEVPVPVYRLPQREKTREMLRIAERLDNAALRLAGCLEAEQIPARPVPLYLPVRLVDGKVQGVVRMKQIAAAGGLGEIGKNTLLLNPRFGSRLLLGGVVTASPGQKTGKRAGPSGAPLCTGCGACTRACPNGAVGPDGVDAFRCRTVRTWVPPGAVPVVKWLIRRQVLLRRIAPLAPAVARIATIRCSLCVTACPAFPGGAEEENSRPDLSGTPVTSAGASGSTGKRVSSPFRCPPGHLLRPGRSGRSLSGPGYRR
ncbi:4Fe-4S binding protein [Methanoculleus sp.]|uniref:4Fe-4S binding protein n=1 Tax=Methanoculleus sp. TaxID=90427 RepID=UPI0025F1C5A1|nr:4Fe-4S binding protein [Methanoculleus sp.]MCK9318884.1 4Fe-4S binding protein [Methanoculleus sp.]MDD2255000.1 4Fe-4S binding protein [Methanoculleus sp.]MDD2788316.1 4Fe-4S binding protein [Methanoculleus sp.]MDD3217195.1 4Fe-4S binding protein [Methanoculleus sp.]MDD4315275.1 4Fe-4S binding protein [Methanoculleus sp.]